MKNMAFIFKKKPFLSNFQLPCYLKLEVKERKTSKNISFSLNNIDKFKNRTRVTDNIWLYVHKYQRLVNEKKDYIHTCTDFSYNFSFLYTQIRFYYQ